MSQPSRNMAKLSRVSLILSDKHDKERIAGSPRAFLLNSQPCLLLLCLPNMISSSSSRTIGLLGSSPHSLDQVRPGLQSDQPAGETSLPDVCLALPGLTAKQISLCSRLPETVESVPFGTRQGLVECEYQFRNELWNCSDNSDNRRIQQTIDRGDPHRYCSVSR